MRVSAVVAALCLMVPYGAVNADNNNNFDLQKTMQDIAAAVKETSEQAAASVAETTAQVQQAMEKLKQEMDEHKKPIEETIGQAAHDIMETVKTGAEQVGDTIAQAAAAIKEELKDEKHHDGANHHDGMMHHGENHHGHHHDGGHHDGENKKCRMACPRIYMPVCGTDGKTYSNKCEMERITCEGGYHAEIKHVGKCADGGEPPVLPEKLKDSCWKDCTDDMKPVCGNDGITYTNKCLFEIEQCHKGGEGMLKIDHDGQCEGEKQDPSRCMKACTRDYRPVCGSDGKTYSNPCVFEIAQCIMDTLKQEPLTLAYRGKCEEEGKVKCPQFCTMDYNPVCGSNGRTYGNRCGLMVDACHHPELNIQLAHVGECISAESAANAANAEESGHPAHRDIGLYIGLAVAFTVLTALVAFFAARKVQLRRFTAVTSHPVAPSAKFGTPAGIAPPGYSKLLSEDQVEEDPEELFAPEYTSGGYSRVKTNPDF